MAGREFFGLVLLIGSIIGMTVSAAAAWGAAPAGIIASAATFVVAVLVGVSE